MSGFTLDSLAENASRLGMRLQETFSEHTRDLAIARGSSSAYLDTADDKLKDVRKQLDSGTDREKLEALKRLVALISKGRNVSEYFAQVVKNVASHNLEVRKLTYIYILRYAEQEPDLALLSINTFQKDLNDQNPLIRAMALRVLSGIRVPMIGSIVVLAIKKCAADPSPYVRKAAAFAIPKCNSLDASHLPELIGIISTLLRDRSPLSVGSVAVAFDAVCPTRLDLLHPHYRRLCRTVVDVDEWGQVNLTELLVRYARTMLTRPQITTSSKDGQEVTEEDVDPDLQLLLSSSEPLFMSRNPAVIMAATRAFYYVGPPSQLSKIVQPLLRVLQMSKEAARVTLAYILVICQEHSSLFAPHYKHFTVRADDPQSVKDLKMRLLACFVNYDNYQGLLREFIDYAEDVDDQLVSSAIQAVGRCATSIPSSTQQCLTALMTFIKSRHEVVISNAVLVLKSLVQAQLLASTNAVAGSSHEPLLIISKLAYRLDEIRHPQARACVLWLVGQYAASAGQEGAHTGAPQGVMPWAPDVLRKSAKTFGQEEPAVKLQIVTLAAKLVVLAPEDRTLVLLARYVFALARYDANYDVRDRARMLSALLAGVAPGVRGDDVQEEVAGVVLRREQVRLVLFEGKGVIIEKEPWKLPTDEGQVLLGSLGTVTGKEMRGDRILPDWLEQGAESSLRDSGDDAPPPPFRAVPTALSSAPRSIGPSAMASPVVLTPTGTPLGVPSGNWKDLDKFYADADEGEEEESEEESEEDDDNDGESEGPDGEEEGTDEDDADADSDEGTDSEVGVPGNAESRRSNR